MSDLVEFLTARLDEDEQAVKRVRQPYRLYVCDDGCIQEPMRVDDLYGEHDGEYKQWADGEDRLPNHRNTWWLMYDPARVLAEVEAKRRILDAWRIAHEAADERPFPHRAASDFADGVLRLLALPYADHEEFDESWRP